MMIWLIEEQIAYALGASAGDKSVMREAEARARARFLIFGVLETQFGFWLYQRL